MKDDDIIQVIAKIKSTTLGFEDHGPLTFMLHCDYGGSAQGVGGFVLSTGSMHDASRLPTSPIGAPLAIDWVARVILACGVDRWEQLPGLTIYVLFRNGDKYGAPIGIENLPTERGERFLFESQRARVQLVEKHGQAYVDGMDKVDAEPKVGMDKMTSELICGKRFRAGLLVSGIAHGTRCAKPKGHSGECAP